MTAEAASVSEQDRQAGSSSSSPPHYDVTALQMTIWFNRDGDHDHNGMVFALTKNVPILKYIDALGKADRPGGQYPPDQLRQAAAARAGEIEVLVATVVVEVGVDVANASAIVIEGAERFGLSQLHQLRGRVCRGQHSPKCFLVGDPKTEESARRLEALAEYQDGFKLSEVDLAIRGEGTLFGSRQSGMPDLKVAKLLRDINILVEARREAFALVEQDPTLKRPDHRPLRREIRELLGSNVEWLFRE